jgi:ATPase family AAA domain-containing protein 3A/B
MFGGNRNNNNRESLSTVMTPDNPPVKKSGGSSVTGFDPEGLERAAKAARELDASRNASQAIELIKTQEVTKQVCVGVFVAMRWKAFKEDNYHSRTFGRGDDQNV